MKFLNYTLLLFLLLGCAKEKKVRYASSSAEIDSVKALVNAYEAGDWERWAGYYADSAKLYHNSTSAVPPGELSKGMAETVAVLAGYGFKDKEQFYEMIVDDNGETWVNFWANWEGHLADPDTTLVIPVHFTAQFVDGKIVEEHAYYNMQPYAELLQSRSQADSIP